MRLRIVAEAAEDERAALLAFVEQLEAAEMQQTEEQLLAMAAEAGMDNVGAWRCGGDGEEGDDDIEELVQFQQYMAEQQLQDDAQQHQQQMHGMTEMVLCPVCCNACLTVRDISGDDNDDDEFYGQNKDTQPDIDEDLDSTNMHQQQKQQRQRQRVVTCDNGCGIILNTSWYQHQSDKNHQQSCTSDDSLCDTPPDCSHGNDEVHARPILQQVRHRLDTVMSAHQAVCPHTLTFVATITTVDDADDANGIIESSNTNNDMDMVDMMTSGQDQQQQRGRKSRSPTPPCALWAQCQRCQQRCRVL